MVYTRHGDKFTGAVALRLSREHRQDDNRSEPSVHRFDRNVLAVTQVTCYTDYVANLTLAIDDELLRRARIRALESGTSVNAAVRDFLVSYTRTSQQDATVQTLIGLAADAGASSGEAERSWTREDIYEERTGS